MANEKGLVALATLGSIVIGILAPLIVFLVKKDEMAENDVAIVKGTLNFELTLLIACIILSFIPVIGWIVLMIVPLYNIIIMILAFMAANDNKEYKFPLTFNFVK